MKRQDNWGVGSSIFLSIVFAGMAILTYQSDPSIAFIPVIGVLVGIVMAIKAANKAADESANKKSSLNLLSIIAVSEMEILKYISTPQIKRRQSVLLLHMVPAKKKSKGL